MGDTGKVISIEASPKIYSYLQQNIKSSKSKNISCIHIACTDHDNIAIEFYDAPDNQFGMGSLAPQFNIPPTLVIGSTFDNILKSLQIGRVDIIKVDVEGFEAAVFRGAVRTLTSDQRPVIIFEFLDWAERRAGDPVGTAQLILFDYGYTLKEIGKKGALGSALIRPITVGGAMLIALPVVTVN